jgi:hypothetical protein
MASGTMTTSASSSSASGSGSSSGDDDDVKDSAAGTFTIQFGLLATAAAGLFAFLA